MPDVNKWTNWMKWRKNEIKKPANKNGIDSVNLLLVSLCIINAHVRMLSHSEAISEKAYKYWITFGADIFRAVAFY